jgi:hypothetical protein
VSGGSGTATPEENHIQGSVEGRLACQHFNLLIDDAVQGGEELPTFRRSPLP